MAAQSKAASSAQSKAAASSAVVSGGLFAGYVAIQLSTLLLASAAQQRDVQTRHVDSTAVTLSELVKLLISLVGIAATERVMLRGLLRAVRQSLLTPSLLRVALPALLYTVQNNVIYSSLARVDAVTFQITFQLKLAASVLASRLLLGKPVSAGRWAAVGLPESTRDCPRLPEIAGRWSDESRRISDDLGLISADLSRWASVGLLTAGVVLVLTLLPAAARLVIRPFFSRRGARAHSAASCLRGARVLFISRRGARAALAPCGGRGGGRVGPVVAGDVCSSHLLVLWRVRRRWAAARRTSRRSCWTRSRRAIHGLT